VGKFDVFLRVTNGAGKDSMTKTQYIDVGLISIPESDNKHYQVYPSPAVNTLFIRNILNDKPENIFITDLNGKTVKKVNDKYFGPGSTISLDISDLGEGFYILEITGKNHILHYRFLKSK
jgi:PKD repeat protein